MESNFSTTSHDEWVTIAQIGAPHGVQGELKVFSLSDVPGRFESLETVFLLSKNKETQRLTVVSARPCERFIILRFEEIKDRDTASQLTNSYLVLPKTQRGQLPEGEYFIDDLIGLTVEDEAGVELGKLVDVYQTGSNDVYEIKGTTGNELLLPARKEVILSIDLEVKKMIVEVPEGY